MPNPEFAFTMKDLILGILGACGAIITISGVFGVFSGWHTSLKKPNKDQDARMDKIEGRLKTVEGRCDTFDKQLEGVKKHLNSLDAAGRICTAGAQPERRQCGADAASI